MDMSKAISISFSKQTQTSTYIRRDKLKFGNPKSKQTLNDHAWNRLNTKPLGQTI